MLYDDDPRRPRHIPIWSTDRTLGRFCGNTTLCTACHPRDCREASCNSFAASDVWVGNVGRSCDRCQTVLGEREA